MEVHALSIVAALAAVLITVPLFVHLVTVVLALVRHLGEEPAVDLSYWQGRLPRVTLIRPVSGLHPDEKATLESSFTLDYRDLEVIFCAASEEEPAVAWLREAMARHPEVDAKVLTGDRQFSGNPKLNNVEKGWNASTGDIVVMTDSNLLLPHDYIERLLENFGEGVGMVSGPPVGRGAQDFWAALECAFLNTAQARWQLAADALGFGFAQGKTLAYRRDVLEKGGGMEALALNLAEDVSSTKLIRGQGLRVRLTRRLFTQPVSQRTAKSAWGRQLRWSQIRREGVPGIFMLEILQGPYLPLIGLVALACIGPLSWWWLLALLILWYGAEWLLAYVADWPHEGRDLGAMIVRDLMLPVLWIRTWTGGGLEWHGKAVTSKGKGTDAGA